MYNTDFPYRADLPSTEKLIGSTIIAGVSALAILITIVLPSEYGIDVTRVGGILGLTEMGQIKMQLAQEAADNEAMSAAVASGNVVVPIASAATADTQALASRMDGIEQTLAALQSQLAAGRAVTLPPVPAVATPAEPIAVSTAPVAAAPAWRDEVSFTLTPMQGTEYKMVMQAGAVANYEFVVDGGVINFDAHGEGEGQSLSYEEGRGVIGDSGQMVAPVSGTHGWFFRNRGDADVVVTLRTTGDYSELRKLI